MVIQTHSECFGF